MGQIMYGAGLTSGRGIIHRRGGDRWFTAVEEIHADHFSVMSALGPGYNKLAWQPKVSGMPWAARSPCPGLSVGRKFVAVSYR
jgi:hypothetical protein